MKTIIVVCTCLLMVASCFAHDYSCREERACRCGGSSNPCDIDTLKDGLSESECESRCDNRSYCQGYEYTSSNKRCEIHKNRGNNFSNPDHQPKPDTTCCWRVTSSSGGSKRSKGGRRLDQVDQAPRRQVSRRTRGRATGRKHRRHAMRVGQKMDAPNARG